MPTQQTLEPIRDGPLITDDAQEAYKRLEQDADRLFASDEVKVLVWPKNEEAPEKELVSITDPTSLAEYIDRPPRRSRSRVFILQQEYTWGHILISLEAFHSLLIALSVFTPFVDYVLAFGLKVSENDENLVGYHCRTSSIASEICYNLRYPDKNGRSTVPQWSIRHAAVYQKYSHEAMLSTWLLIQPSQYVKERIEHLIQSNGGLDFHPLMLHLVIISASEKNWRQYLNDVQEELNELDYKARFAKSTIADEDSFYVQFGDNQLLHRRRQKLLKSSLILDSSIEIAQGCMQFCHWLSAVSDPASSCSELFLVEMALYISKIRGHKRTVNLLLRQSTGTSNLLSQVLQFRHEEAITKINALTQHNSQVLADIGTVSRKDNAAIKMLTEQARRDTRSTKILTFIALLYLPASLVATVFSSDLLVAVDKEHAIRQTRFVAATQFWIYPVSTGALIVLTVMPLLFFEKYKSKRNYGASSIS